MGNGARSLSREKRIGPFLQPEPSNWKLRGEWGLAIRKQELLKEKQGVQTRHWYVWGFLVNVGHGLDLRKHF